MVRVGIVPSPKLRCVSIAWLNRIAATIALVAWTVVASINTSLHLDMARDIFVIQQAQSYDGLPTIGPVFAGYYHLGPVWFWLVMFWYHLTGSLQGLMAGMMGLVALQFPLAYQAGKAWHSRQAGWLLAALISIPSWMTLQIVLPLHSMFTAGCLLAALWRFRRFLDTGRIAPLCQTALALSLGSHAHPAIVIVLPILCAGIPRLWTMGYRGAGAFALALGSYVLLFLPAIFTMNRPLDDLILSNASTFIQGPISRAPSLALQAIHGGIDYVASLLFAPGSAASHFAKAWAAAASFFIVFGIFLASRRKLIFLVWLAAAAVLLAVMRPVSPYYMLTPLFVLTVFVAAVGLAELSRPLRMIVIVGSVAFGALFMIQWHRLQARGDWPLAFQPMFNVTGAADAPMSFINIRARDAEAFAKFSCRESPVLHGPAAWVFFATYQVESRWACGRPAACIGVCGDGRAANAWLGASRAVFSRLGVVSAQSFGALQLVPVKRSVLSAELPILSAARYPPLDASAITSRCGSFHVSLAAGETLAVSNLSFAFTPDPGATLHGERDFPPTTQDFSTSYWRSDKDLHATLSVPCKGLTEAVVF